MLEVFQFLPNFTVLELAHLLAENKANKNIKTSPLDWD